MRDGRIKASEEEIARSLEGTGRKQEQAGYDFCQQQIAACDERLEKYLKGRTDRSGRRKKKRGNSPQFDMRESLYRSSGVDLTKIDGVDVMTAATVLSEAGWGHEQVGNGEAFRVVAAAMPGQPDQRGQGDREGETADEQPVEGGVEDGSEYIAGKQYVFGGAVSKTAREAGSAESDPGDGSETGAVGVSDVAAGGWNTWIEGQNSTNSSIGNGRSRLQGGAEAARPRFASTAPHFMPRKKRAVR